MRLTITLTTHRSRSTSPLTISIRVLIRAVVRYAISKKQARSLSIVVNIGGAVRAMPSAQIVCHTQNQRQRAASFGLWRLEVAPS